MYGGGRAVPPGDATPPGAGGAGWMLGFAVVEMVIVVLALARRAQLPQPSPAREPHAVAVP